VETVKLDPTSFFAALADPTRLQLLHILARQPAGRPLCVKALAMRLGVSQPAVSQHLQVLRSVGLVYPVRRGMRVHYHLDRERLLSWQKLVHELFAEPGGTIAQESEAEQKGVEAAQP